jgi:hypothetical protein
MLIELFLIMLLYQVDFKVDLKKKRRLFKVDDQHNLLAILHVTSNISILKSPIYLFMYINHIVFKNRIFVE